MEVLLIVIITAISAAFLLYYIKTLRMRKIMENVPKIPFFDIPWISGLMMSLKKRKSRNYGGAS